jgi:hypothetical protein
VGNIGVPAAQAANDSSMAARGLGAAGALRVFTGLGLLLYPSKLSCDTTDCYYREYPEMRPDNTPVSMAKGGKQNQEHDMILEAWLRYDADCKLFNKKDSIKDRCKWLEKNKHLFPARAVKATEKDWGCRHSTASKDKIRK